MILSKISLGGRAHKPDHVNALYELGLEFAEISIPGPEGLSALIKDYQTKKKQLGLYYLCHGPAEGNPNDTDTLETVYLKKLLKILPLLRDLETTILTIHLWMDARFVSKKTIQYKMGLLNRLTEAANKFGITICLENLSEHSDHLKEVFENTPLLKLTLDLGHAQLLAERNTSLGFMANFPDRIEHIHLHDNRGGWSPKDDLHLPVGEGIIDFNKLLRKLKETGYSKTMTLELRPQEIKQCLPRVKDMLLQA